MLYTLAVFTHPVISPQFPPYYHYLFQFCKKVRECQTPKCKVLAGIVCAHSPPMSQLLQHLLYLLKALRSVRQFLRTFFILACVMDFDLCSPCLHQKNYRYCLGNHVSTALVMYFYFHKHWYIGQIQHNIQFLRQTSFLFTK